MRGARRRFRSVLSWHLAPLSGASSARKSSISTFITFCERNASAKAPGGSRRYRQCGLRAAPPLIDRMLQLPSFSLNLGRRGAGADVVGLDVQPGLVAAVKARVNGHILAERAAAQPLDADTVREGEVVDVEALSHALRELFADGSLGKRVRVGIANQRTVMRTLDLPPVSDRKELAAAVRFQAQDQVPMPLSNAV